MKNKKIYLITGIVIVLLLSAGVYGYFINKERGNTNVVDTNELKVIYSNGDSIKLEKTDSGLETTKSFSIENKTNSDYNFNLLLKDLNSSVNINYLKYKITSDDSENNMTDFKDISNSDNNKDIVLIHNAKVPSKTTRTYKLSIKYTNNSIQNNIIGKLFIDKENNEGTNTDIGSNTGTNIGSTSSSLIQAMLRDNTNVKERKSFNNINAVNTTGTIYKTNKTEDGSDVYYYSGNTTNNWVKFGKISSPNTVYRGYYYNGGDEYYLYADLEDCNSSLNYGEECSEYKLGNVGDDIYWRIIRSNEDGSVRLLYAGTSPDTVDGVIGQSKYNLSYDDPLYLGYMYGTMGTLESNRTNENDSTVKSYIDNWYQNNLLANYDKYISKSAIYCNDRSTGDETYLKSSIFHNGTFFRITNYKPSYKCGANISNGLFESTQSIADKFSTSKAGGGNGKLKYPIALMTADEVSFAGGKESDGFRGTHSWYSSNGKNKSITGIVAWWTMSPASWLGTIGKNSFAYDVQVTHYLKDNTYYYGTLDFNFSNALFGVRPVISLSSCNKVKSGNGTPSNPYEIDYNNSCN